MRFPLLKAIASITVVAYLFTLPVPSHAAAVGKKFKVFEKAYSITDPLVQIFTDNFKALNPSATYTLRLTNTGNTNIDLDSYVILNTQIATGPKKAGAIEQNVNLALDNRMVVIMFSGVGSGIHAEVFGMDSKIPGIKVIKPVVSQTLPQTSTPIEIELTDDFSGIDPKSFKLLVNNVDVTKTLSAPLASLSTIVKGTIQLKSGKNTLQISASDLATNAASQTVTLTVEIPNKPPVVNAGADAQVTLPASLTLKGKVTDDALPVGKPLTVLWSKVFGLGNVSFANPNTAVTTATFSEPGSYTLELSGSDTQYTVKDQLMVTVKPDPNIPPDPVQIAPDVDSTTATTIDESTEFLYTGTNPIQKGVQAGAIKPVRAAILRGRILNRSKSPISTVQVTVKDHPEFGSTKTRKDGFYDMAVNGDGELTLLFQQQGFLLADRTVKVDRQDFTLVDDVIMIEPDPKAASIDLSISNQIQVAQATTVTDSDGTRQSTLFFLPGTAATLVLPNGTTQGITRLTVRSSEYTVGDNGPEAMPADLPPSSGYTYATEFTIDEAVTQGATTTRFSQPVINYLDNFLGLPTGTVLPAGSYDRKKTTWVPGRNGVVVKIVSIANNVAQIDTNNDGVAESSSALLALGITALEQGKLAQLYPAGKSLWRVPLEHFSPWDINFPFGPPTNAQNPNNTPPTQEEGKPNDPCTQSGSIIECENQILGEEVPLKGTPFSLHYVSDRVLGYRSSATAIIPLTTATVSPSLKSVVLEIEIAGRKFTKTFPPNPNQNYTFQWDLKDVYDREIKGLQPATIRIGYVYDGVYYEPSFFVQSFAAFSQSNVPMTFSREDAILWKESKINLGISDIGASHFGEWSLSNHHVYDVKSSMLYKGDGTRNSLSGAKALSRSFVIETVAGDGTSGFAGDGGPALNAKLDSVGDIVFGPDGSMYIDDNTRIRKIAPDGIITTVAGNGSTVYNGDGKSAIGAGMDPRSIDVDRNGDLYIADQLNNRIRKVAPDGIITTVAGNGTRKFSGDGGPATDASLGALVEVAVDTSGNIYFNDGTSRIRRVSPSGIIQTIAGTGVLGNTGDGGPAEKAKIQSPDALEVGPDGSIYFSHASSGVIRKISPDGIINRVAGTGGSPSLCSQFEGENAKSRALGAVLSIEVGPDNSIYFSESSTGNRVRHIDPFGILKTFAGSLSCKAGFKGDGDSPINALLSDARGVALGPDGSLYVSDGANRRIRRIRSILPGFSSSDITLPSDDGSEIYVFNGAGKHLKTLNALTGTTLYSFSYDSAGLLSKVTDGDGDVTSIARDSGGNPLSLTSRDGQITKFAVNAQGRISTITDPQNNVFRIGYDANGLLTSFTNPKNNATQYTYDSVGRLTRAADPENGSKTLSRVDLPQGREVAIQTAMGKLTKYKIESFSDNTHLRTVVGPDSTQSTVRTDAAGKKTITSPDGTVATLIESPDPRLGSLVLFPQESTVQTPKGLKSVATSTRTVTSNPAEPLNLLIQTDTTNVNGRIYSQVFDATTKTLTHITPANRVTTSLIDAQERVLQESVSGIDSVNYAYDTRGRLIRISQGAGSNARTIQLTYGADGFLQKAVDPAGRQTQFTYDKAGRPLTQTLPDGRIIKFTYDANGNLASLTPPGKSAHAFNYNKLDQESEYLPPDVNVGVDKTVYEYNLDHDLTKIIRPDGVSVSLGYDTAGRLNTLTIPQGKYTYGYSTTGQLSSIAAPGNLSLAYVYDGSLLLSTAWAGGGITGNVSYAYDNDFRITSQSVNGTNAVSFTYDKDSLLTGAGSLTLTRNSQNGLLTGTSLGNVTDALTYSSFAELASYAAKFQTTSLFSQSYTRDKLARLTQKVENIQGVSATYSYTYDTAGRLTQVKKNNVATASYAYDSNSNRTSMTTPQGTTNATYDSQDRLLTYGSSKFTYTANGELLSKTQGAAQTTYTYDALSNLRKVVLPGNVVIDYLIDGQNRRIGKKKNNLLVQGFLYQGSLKPIAELDSSGSILSRFIYGTRSNIPDYLVKGGVTYRIISDHLGSPRLIVNIQTGQVLQSITYDEFGNIIQDTNPGFQPFGFAGGLYDQDTKLLRFGARDYDPTIGRWTAKDPIDFKGGDVNLYAYAFNDPVNFIDQEGYFAYAAALGGLGGFGVLGGLGAIVLAFFIALAIVLAANELGNSNEGNKGKGEGEGGSGSGSGSGETCHPYPVPNDPELENALNQLYRKGNRIPGGTAGAVAHERKTGGSVGGKRHSQKAKDYSKQLEKMLRRKPSASDRGTIEAELQKLREALNTPLGS